MKYCTQCGASLLSPVDHCPYCGAPTPYAASVAEPQSESPAAASAQEANASAPQQPAEPAQQSEPQAPGPNLQQSASAADEAPFTLPPSSSEPSSGPHYKKAVRSPQSAASLTAVQYMLTFLLFTIPVVGLIAMLVYAFSEPGNPRRTLARGYLLFQLILFGLSAILILIVIFLLFKAYPIQYYQDYYTHMPNPYSGDYYYSQPYDDYSDYGSSLDDYFGYYFSDPSDYYGDFSEPAEVPQHNV